MTGEPLALAHGSALAPLLAARWKGVEPPEATLADPWFANLYLFRHAHDWRLLDGAWLRIAGRSYDGTRLQLPLFDLAAVPPDVVRALLAGHDAFGPLSSAQAARLDPAGWTFTQSRDEAEYLYPADQFRHYRGRLLQKKRNLVTQLMAAHEIEAVPFSADRAAEAARVLDGWMDDKARQPGDADDAPCREALALADRLGLVGTLYRIGGRPAGFVLTETIRPGVSVMRFAKALAIFKGLYQHMFQQFCLARPEVRWVNFEQDLGIPNFRRTKLSYQPAALLAKLHARPR